MKSRLIVNLFLLHF